MNTLLVLKKHMTTKTLIAISDEINQNFINEKNVKTRQSSLEQLKTDL